LTLFYFTILPPFGIGMRLFGDPLNIRPGKSPGWSERSDEQKGLVEARRLF
jgi:hypothetical protein